MNGKGYPDSYCKACKNERRAQAYRDRPKTKADANRRAWDALKGDPERIAVRREQRRNANRQKRNGGASRPNLQPYSGGTPQPAGPFVAWLRTLGEESGEIAEATGIDSRQIRHYLNGTYPTVALDVIDRACIKVGIHLDDIYPLGATA